MLNVYVFFKRKSIDLLFLLSIFIFSFPSHAEETPPSSNYYIIVLPSTFSKSMSEEIHKNISNLLYKLKASDVVEIINGENNKKIAGVTIPKGISDAEIGKQRFFDRNLKGYMNHVKLIDEASKKSIDIRNIIDYVHEMKNINKDKYSSIKVVVYGDVFSSIANASENIYYSYSLDDHKAIYETSSKRYFGTKDRNLILKDVLFFLFPLYESNTNTEEHKQKSSNFLSNYICNQSGKIKIHSNIALLESIALEKHDFFDEQKKCQISNHDGSLLDPKVADIIPAIEMFEKPVIKNPPFPTSEFGYVKVGLRWDYNACQEKDKNCDLDLRVSPSKFDSEISFRNQDSPNYGWYKKLDLKKKNNSYEIIDLARQPVNIDDATIYINFYSGKASEGIDIELRVVFNDQVYRKEIHMNVKNGNDGKEPRSEPNWIEIKLRDILMEKTNEVSLKNIEKESNQDRGIHK